MTTTDSSAARDDALAAFLASSPPRIAPPLLRRAAYRQTISWVYAVFGGVLLAFSLVFTAVFVPWSFYRDWRLAADDTTTVNGQVLSVDNANLTLDERRVVRYEFLFQVPGGTLVRGACFTTGPRWKARAIVPVRYRPENPSVCCLEGARSSAGDGGSAFIVVFPLIGAAMIAWFVISRRRMAALLERGVVGEALITDIQRTRVTVNNRPVFQIVLRRTDSAAGGTLTVRRYEHNVVKFAQDRLASNQPVFVLYDPAKPNRTLLPETL